MLPELPTPGSISDQVFRKIRFITSVPSNQLNKSTNSKSPDNQSNQNSILRKLSGSHRKVFNTSHEKSSMKEFQEGIQTKMASEFLIEKSKSKDLIKIVQRKMAEKLNGKTKDEAKESSGLSSNLTQLAAYPRDQREEQVSLLFKMILRHYSNPNSKKILMAILTAAKYFFSPSYLPLFKYIVKKKTIQTQSGLSLLINYLQKVCSIRAKVINLISDRKPNQAAIGKPIAFSHSADFGSRMQFLFHFGCGGELKKTFHLDAFCGWRNLQMLRKCLQNSFFPTETSTFWLGLLHFLKGRISL